MMCNSIQEHHVFKILALFFLCLLLFTPAPGQTNSDGKIGRDLLQADLFQLVNLLETVHPDPYINGGGKIAFHRRFFKTLKKIPPTGMNRDEFFRLIQPFIAAIGDSHTSIGFNLSTYKYTGGIPLFFSVIEQSLYVYGAPKPYKDLLGARLLSVEGISWDKLVKRSSIMVSHESHLQLLMFLSRDLMLWHSKTLKELIPEWSTPGRIRVTLKHPDGQIKEHMLKIPGKMTTPLHYSGSRITLPSREKSDFVYSFLDNKKQTALLVIDRMDSYREMWQLNPSADKEKARKIYERFHGARAPENDQDLLAGLPSCADLFKSLVKEMKQAGTENLLIDLRENRGGDSMMADILIYCLFGKETMVAKPLLGSKVIKLHKKKGDDAVSPEGIRYSFREDFFHFGYPPAPVLLAGIKQRVSRSPDLKKEFESGEYSGYYRPKNILVLVSPYTFSSAYTMMRKLKRAGAVLVGSPSAQAHSKASFGNASYFKLKNSGIPVYISREGYNVSHIFQPDYTLTYEKLASFRFDMNAEILFALEILARGDGA